MVPPAYRGPTVLALRAVSRPFLARVPGSEVASGRVIRVFVILFGAVRALTARAVPMAGPCPPVLAYRYEYGVIDTVTMLPVSTDKYCCISAKGDRLLKTGFENPKKKLSNYSRYARR